MNPLVQHAANLLRAAGFDDVELKCEKYDTQHFGNAEAVFRVGSLLIRFQRERAQDFVDLASPSRPEEFHQFDDVDIAMGWKSVEAVLAKREPEDLGSVLTRLARNFAHLEEAFSGEQERFTRARVEKAAKSRGEAFVARLRR
ncbi:MAG: hypothetical protein JW940_37410 [Polyangiaceae bacterium]|nr:hypothetical protein [Polyangiaceae bacterium]